MQATITTWGNSFGIRIPKNLAKMLNFEIGNKLKLNIEKDKLILSKPKTYKLEDLVSAISEKNKPQVVNWNTPKGKELW